MLSLAQYQALPVEQQRVRFDQLCFNAKANPKKEPVKPNWLPGLYCNLLFPRHFSQTFSVSVQEGNILDGNVEYDGVVMKWWGYASQLYDGQLKLSCCHQNRKNRRNQQRSILCVL